MNRKFIILLFTLMMVSALAACSSADENTGAAESDGESADIPTITLGIGFATEEPLWLLDVNPELAENNGVKYNLEFEQFRANADRLNAYQAGQLDGGTLGQGALIMAADQGVDLKVVASVAKDTPEEGYNHPFLASADADYSSLDNLKGKTIGVVDFKSPTDLWARNAVRNAGLDPDKDVDYAVLPVPAMTEAVKSGKVDIGMVPQPFYAEVEDSGDFQTVFTSKDGVQIDEDFLSLFFNGEFIAENEEAFEAFISDYQNAMTFYLENLEEARQMLLDAEFVLAEPDIFLTMEDSNRSPDLSLDLSSWNELHDMLLDEGWIENEVDLDELIDVSYLE